MILTKLNLTGSSDVEELYNKIMRTQEAVVRNREQQIKDEVGLIKTIILLCSLIYYENFYKL